MLIFSQGGSSSIFGKIIKYTIENFASHELANEIEVFFSTKNTCCTERTIKQALESIKNNAAWLLRDGKLIEDYLMNKVPCAESK